MKLIYIKTGERVDVPNEYGARLIERGLAKLDPEKPKPPRKAKAKAKEAEPSEPQEQD